MLTDKSKIYIAGHKGMVGSAIFRQLREKGFNNLITRDSSELDLRDQRAVASFMQAERPDYVVLAAAKVGGINANNQYPAEFIYENLIIEANVVHQAYRADVQQLLFLGSSCIYPKMAPQPMAEAALLTGPLEPTNEPYAIAKIAGIKLCESYNRQYGVDFRSVMPTNLYGPGDNFHPENSHVIPALMRRIHEAKESGAPSVEIWGSGQVRREFLHVDDMASASIHVMQLPHKKYMSVTEQMLSHINVGSGSDITIKALAETLVSVIGFEGQILFDRSKPDGTPRKLMDCSKINALAWQPSVALEQGLAATYDWFLGNQNCFRA